MAKEDIEKPKKKAGMVLVIGLGGKPSKNIKKADGDSPRRKARGFGGKRFDALRANRRGLHDILRAKPERFYSALDRRQVGKEQFDKVLQAKHGFSIEEMKNMDSLPEGVNLDKILDEAAAEAAATRRSGRQAEQASRQQRTQRPPVSREKRIKDLLGWGGYGRAGADKEDVGEFLNTLSDDELRNISPQQALDRMFDEWKGGSDEAEEPEKPEKPFRGYSSEAGEDAFAAMRRQRGLDDKDDEPTYDDEDDDFDEDSVSEHMRRILSARYGSPSRAAAEAEVMASGDWSDDSKYGPLDPRIGYQHRATFREPSTVFTVPFAGSGDFSEKKRVGRNNPEGSVESELYGFRGASPFAPAPKDDDEFMTSSDSRAVIDVAFALLKQMKKPDDEDVEDAFMDQCSRCGAMMTPQQSRNHQCR